MVDKIEKLPFRGDLELVGFEILTIKDLYKNNDILFLASTKSIQFYEIIFITEGEGEHQIDFKTYLVKKGDVIFVGKNKLHSWKKIRMYNGYILIFTEDFLYQNQIQFNDLSYEYPYNSILYSPVLKIKNLDYYESFLALVELILKEYDLISYSAKQDVLQILLRTFILKAQSQLPSKYIWVNSVSKTLFVDFQKKLDEHIMRTRNVIDYVNMMGTTYYHLNLAVKQFSGQSVKSFIDRILLLKAKQLLASPYLNINEVSYSLGFDEATNFSKFFKKHTGNTPKHFKEQEKQYIQI